MKPPASALFAVPIVISLAMLRCWLARSPFIVLSEASLPGRGGAVFGRLVLVQPRPRRDAAADGFLPHGGAGSLDPDETQVP